MNVQYDNRVVSSLLLFIDHEIQAKGEAFTNYSGRFFPISGGVQGYRTYATPFKQLCNDTSISGATIASGVYLNGNFVSVGQSGLHAINHYQGAVYFSGASTVSNSTVISGNYAIKDFNVEFSDQPEYKLLFETKYVTNSKYNQTLSGLPLDTKTSPSVFVTIRDTDNKPFAFQRIDENSMKVRLVVITDNEFQRIGVCNILKNLNLRQLPLYSSTPFDANGNFTGVNYNYNNLSLDTGYYPWIMSSKVVSVPKREDLPNFNKSMALVDLEISTVMSHS